MILFDSYGIHFSLIVTFLASTYLNSLSNQKQHDGLACLPLGEIAA